MVRRCARDVREEDADLARGRDPFAQRLRADRVAQRFKDRRLFIRQTGAMCGFDDRRAIIRKIDGQLPLSVCQLNFHLKRVAR